MFCIHNVVMVIHHAYPEHLPDHGRDSKKDCFYHGLHPYFHDALSFAMAELLKREQARPMFDTLYTLVKKLEAGQPAGHAVMPWAWELIERSTGTTLCQQEGWRPWRKKEWHCLIPPLGRTPKLEVEVVDGLNMRLAQEMSHYQREERKCFVCGSPDHFARDCPHDDGFKRWHQEQLNTKGASKNNLSALRMMNQ